MKTKSWHTSNYASLLMTPPQLIRSSFSETLFREMAPQKEVSSQELFMGKKFSLLTLLWLWVSAPSAGVQWNEYLLHCDWSFCMIYWNTDAWCHAVRFSFRCYHILNLRHFSSETEHGIYRINRMRRGSKGHAISCSICQCVFDAHPLLSPTVLWALLARVKLSPISLSPVWQRLSAIYYF